MEEAIKKRKSDAAADQSTLQHLHRLLNEAQAEDGSSQDAKTSPALAEPVYVPVKEVVRPSSDDQLAVEDVENPLQLLARASDLRIATTPQSYNTSVASPEGRFTGSEQSAFLDVHHFFLPMKAHLDQGSGLDPIDVGLVSKDEAEMLLQ